MDSFFINITKGLEIKEDNESNANTLEDVLDVLNSQPSIERIKRTIKTNENFSFQPVLEDLVDEIILSLDGSKATLYETFLQIFWNLRLIYIFLL